MSKVDLHDWEAESRLIGCLLGDAEILWHHELREDLFHDQRHRAAFQAISDLATRGEHVDVATVADAVRTRLDVPMIATYLAECQERALDSVPGPLVQILAGYAERRELARIHHFLNRVADDLTQDHRAAAGEALDRLAQLTTRVPQPVVTADVAAREYLSKLEAREPGALRGIPTGLRDLDFILGGLQRRELLVVGARTSVGKSALIHNVVPGVVERGYQVLLCTPEMFRDQVVERLLACRAQVDLRAIRSRVLSQEEWQRLRHAVAEMPAVGLYDAGHMLTADIQAVARQRKAREGLDLLIVDHLGYLADEPRKGESRAILLGRTTKALKALARLLDCAVVLVCQLNRGSESGSTMRRPGLADLRDSGEIEQDADTVLLVHRETREAEEAEAIVAKARNGPTGAIRLRWSEKTTTFHDWDDPTAESWA